MRLYIKRDTTAHNSMYVVFNEHCKEKYLVIGTKDKLRITNLKGEAVLKIRRLPSLGFRLYSVTADKHNIKLLINSTNSATNCMFHGIGWHLRGNAFIKSFDIIDADNSLVAVHSKRFSPCGDGYELNVIREDRELFCIATAICINLEAKVDSSRLQPV